MDTTTKNKDLLFLFKKLGEIIIVAEAMRKYGGDSDFDQIIIDVLTVQENIRKLMQR